MAARDVPYPAFNFILTVGGGEAFGGFSEISGLQTEFTVGEYRTGDLKTNHTRKVQTVFKTGDVTCKRGMVGDSKDLWSWIRDTRTKGPAAKRQVSIVLRDEAGQPVATWNLTNVIPLKFTMPPLKAAAGGELAIEDLVLSAESIDLAD